MSFREVDTTSPETQVLQDQNCFRDSSSRLAAADMDRMQNLPDVDKILGTFTLVSSSEAKEQKSKKDKGDDLEQKRDSLDKGAPTKPEEQVAVDPKARQDHIEGEIMQAKSDGVEKPEEFVQKERERLEKMNDKDLDKELNALNEKVKNGTMTPEDHVRQVIIISIESERYQKKHESLRN